MASTCKHIHLKWEMHLIFYASVLCALLLVRHFISLLLASNLLCGIPLRRVFNSLSWSLDMNSDRYLKTAYRHDHIRRKWPLTILYISVIVITPSVISITLAWNWEYREYRISLIAGGLIFHHACFNCLHTTPPRAAIASDWIWLRFYAPRQGR